MLRGVIYDMDGVLCDSEPFICEAACRMFEQRHGIRVPPADFAPFVGAGEDRYLGGVAEKYGVTLTMPGDKQLTYRIYLDIIRGRLRPLAGVKAFVTACQHGGLAQAVATSADRVKLDGNLREIGLPEETFRVCVTGDDVQRKKPHPDIFLLAAARLGLPAEACLVIEDAPNGVRSARSAGARCLALTSSFSAAELTIAGANWIAPDLAHIPVQCLRVLGIQG